MIVFDLKCAQSHVFEVWFASTQAYEQQKAGGLILCPYCASADVEKAVMAPRISTGAKGREPDRGAPSDRFEGDNQAVAVASGPAGQGAPSAQEMRQLLSTLAKMQAAALQQSTWVGGNFADRARAMHYGEEEQAPIHGQASIPEAEALIEEGVSVMPLPFPVVPGEAKN